MNLRIGSLLFFLSLGSPLLAREISLSFDDAPTFRSGRFSGVERTQTLIETLKDSDVKQVVFFCNTKDIKDEGAARLRAYAKAGHLIANHTHSHPDLHQVGSEEFIADFIQAHEILKSFPNFVRWFRFPFLRNGKTDAERHKVESALKQLGYRHGYVTIDNYDYYMSQLYREAVLSQKKIDYAKLKRLYVTTLYDAVEFYDRLAQRLLGRSPRHTLLLHENDLAALFVEDLVKQLRSKGWTIISPSMAYEDPIAQLDPDINFGQGLISRIARSRGLPDHELRAKTEDEAYLKAIFTKEQVFAERENEMSPVEAQFEAYNLRDIEAFAKCFSDDVLVTKEGTEKPLLRGIKDFKAYYAKIFSESPKLHARLIKREEKPPYIYDTEEVTGRAETNGLIRAVARYKITDNKISEVHFRYLD